MCEFVDYVEVGLINLRVFEAHDVLHLVRYVRLPFFFFSACAVGLLAKWNGLSKWFFRV